MNITFNALYFTQAYVMNGTSYADAGDTRLITDASQSVMVDAINGNTLYLLVSSESSAAVMSASVKIMI